MKDPKDIPTKPMIRIPKTIELDKRVYAVMHKFYQHWMHDAWEFQDVTEILVGFYDAEWKHTDINPKFWMKMVYEPEPKRVDIIIESYPGTMDQDFYFEETVDGISQYEDYVRMVGHIFLLKDGIYPERYVRELECYDLHIERKADLVNPFQKRRRVGQLTLGDFA